MRALACLLFVAATGSAEEADEFFEVGLGYLKTAFYKDARAAFAESLVRAPGEAVPTAFAAIACAGEGRDSRSCAYLFRLAYRRLPKKTGLRIDLNVRLRSSRDLARLEARFAERLKGARGQNRLDNLTVLAFLQVHDGSPESSTALATLLKAQPDDPYAVALKKLSSPRKKAPKKKKPAPKTES